VKAQGVTGSQPSFVDGVQAVVPWWLGFLIHFRGKIRVDPSLKTSCVPASSVQIRGSLSGVIRAA
jgi:hypothetical protein